MNPLVDQLIVAVLILGALAFFGLRFVRRGKGCGSDCGCATKSKPGKMG
jgi:hypothetical protein